VARRRRSTRGTINDSFKNYGMPSRAALMKQARDLAAAGAPTLGSINRQYDRAESDVTGLNQALAEMLKGIDPSGGYDQAVSQQRLLDDAAAARLAEAGVNPDAVAAQSGMTGSASSALVSQGAAARQWATRQPVIAHARASTAIVGLENAQQDALKQRAEAIRQGTLQAYPQLQQSALSRATALAQLIGNNRQFSEAQRQFNTQQAFNQQQLGEQSRQFNVSTRMNSSQFWADLGFRQDQAAAAAQAAKSGQSAWTPSQWRSMTQDAFQLAEGFNKGVRNDAYDPHRWLRNNDGSLQLDKNGQRQNNPDYDPNRWRKPPKPTLQGMQEAFRFMIGNGQIPPQIALAALRAHYPGRCTPTSTSGCATPRSSGIRGTGRATTPTRPARHGNP
jgi:hypothetical protein